MPFKSNLPEIMQINVFSFNYNNKIRTYYKTYNKYEKHKKHPVIPTMFPLIKIFLKLFLNCFQSKF